MHRSTLTLALLLGCGLGLTQASAIQKHITQNFAHSDLVPSAQAATLQNKFQKAYGKLPLSFEANLGQTDRQVRFLSRGRGYSLFLMPTEATIALSKPKGLGSDNLGTRSTKEQTAQTQAVVRMSLSGANPGAVLSAEQSLPGKVNHFIGKDPSQEYFVLWDRIAGERA
ncbi:MAG: hypothetical protein KME03_02115 [Aphanocapsa lilacina HA4352-LM1]|jgi:hypothetical protein|nr:hypothetical protein [Aphanocapsa lilacina HA4352-LM1]